jgi:hypothetical protein
MDTAKFKGMRLTDIIAALQAQALEFTPENIAKVIAESGFVMVGEHSIVEPEKTKSMSVITPFSTPETEPDIEYVPLTKDEIIIALRRDLNAISDAYYAAFKHLYASDGNGEYVPCTQCDGKDLYCDCDGTGVELQDSIDFNTDKFMEAIDEIMTGIDYIALSQPF